MAFVGDGIPQARPWARDVLASLTREEGVIFKMAIHMPLTHEELGMVLGVSRSRVQAIEQGALRKIGEAMAGSVR